MGNFYFVLIYQLRNMTYAFEYTIYEIFFIASIMIFAIPTLQASAEETSKDQEQKQASDSEDRCKDNLVQVLRYDGKSEYVEPENVLKLIESGWISQKNIDQISILNKRMHEISDDTYAFQFDYCAAVYNKGALGIIVSSSIGRIPIQIDPNIKEQQCHQYGRLKITWSNIDCISICCFNNTAISSICNYLHSLFNLIRRCIPHQVCKQRHCNNCNYASYHYERFCLLFVVADINDISSKFN